MKHNPWYSLVAIVMAQALFFPARAQDAASAHHPAAVEGAGLNKQLVAGITEADFIKLGDQPNTVKVTLVATFNGENYGMNFDGYAHGKATFTIPVGWTVDVTFINPSPVPHSAVVVDRDAVRKLQVGEPAFPGGATPSATNGLINTKATFKFTASETGKYAFACGFPSHALAGHWVALDISAEAKVPTLTLGNTPPQEAK
jgi:plastocyanin